MAVAAKLLTRKLVQSKVAAPVRAAHGVGNSAVQSGHETVTSMSHRQSVLLGGIAAVILLRAVGTGKLGRAWSAIWSGGGTPKTPSPGTFSDNNAQAGVTFGPGNNVNPNYYDWTSGGGTNPNIPSGYPQASIFGLPSTGSFFDYITQGSDVSIKQADTAGIKSVLPGSYAAHDFDYGVQSGTPFVLPGGPNASYEVLPSWKEGRTVIVTETHHPNTVIEFLHLSADYLTGMAGKVFPGGTVVGKSGAPSGPNEYGSGAHLAVVVNPQGYDYLMSIQKNKQP